MRAESFEFLRELMNTPTPSGFETPGQRVWANYARQFADEVTNDAYGNTMAVLNPGAKPVVVLDGHIDELGLVVKHIDDKGFICVSPIGYHSAPRLLAARVEIHSSRGPVLGVVTTIPPHMTAGDDRPKKELQTYELSIDIGAKDAKDARKRVAIGDPITVVDELRMLTDDVMVARAFDDRIGAFTALETLRLIAEQRDKLRCCVIAHSAIQEEVGIFGAAMSVFNIRPDVAIAVEAGICSDHPGVDQTKFGVIELGGGTVIYIGRENHPELIRRFRAHAKDAKLPLQVMPHDEGHGTNASNYYVGVGGVPSAVIGIPCRYIHSVSEVSTLSDIDRTARLLAAVCLDIKKGETFRVKV